MTARAAAVEPAAAPGADGLPDRPPISAPPTLLGPVMVQLTLVSERWPLRRLGRISSGPVALAMAWSIALALDLLLVRTHPKSDSTLYRRSGGMLSGAEFGAVLTAIALWQVWF